MFFDGLKGDVADVVLHLTGIFTCGYGINTDTCQKLGENGMALVNFFGNADADLGQVKITILVNGDISAVLQKTDGTTDTGFGKAHMLTNVDRADGGTVAGKNIYSFKVHLTRFQ